jgi:hypothetical protein
MVNGGVSSDCLTRLEGIGGNRSFLSAQNGNTYTGHASSPHMRYLTRLRRVGGAFNYWGQTSRVFLFHFCAGLDYPVPVLGLFMLRFSCCKSLHESMGLDYDIGEGPPKDNFQAEERQNHGRAGGGRADARS